MAENITEQRQKRTTRQKVAAGLVLGGFWVVPAAGAVAGAELGVHQEHTANHRDVQRAQGYERCLTFSQAMYEAGRVVLKASEIPVQTQKDCRLNDLLASIKVGVKQAMSDANIDVPLHSKATLTYDPDIALASPDVIEHAVYTTEQDSKTSGIGTPIAESLTGFLGGICTEGAALAAFGLYLSHRDRPFELGA